MAVTITEQNNWSHQAQAQLNTLIAASEVVLQYGCGAITETLCQAENIKSVLAVEANKAVSDSLYEAIEQKDKLHMMYSNIGQLGADNQPIDDSQVKQYHQYMILPWALADKYATMPNLIVIDGQFKVASFLYSLVCAPEGAKIIFNYFFNHPDHEALREYATLEGRYGDAAVFVVRKNYILSEITAMIAKYSVISE